MPWRTTNTNTFAAISAIVTNGNVRRSELSSPTGKTIAVAALGGGLDELMPMEG
jgi:hypothetical protein